MDVPEYFMDNPESYSELFECHATKLAKLMKIMDMAIINEDLPPVGRSRDLFRMVMDMSYQVDRAYKRKHEIKDPEYTVSTLLTREKYQDEMREVFTQEFNKYIDDFNCSVQKYIDSLNDNDK
jgi:hypothetical protein